MIFITLASIASYWMALPTINAYRFKHAVENGDFSAADSLLVDDRPRAFSRLGTEEQLREATVTIRPLTWHEFLHGERRLHVYIPYGSEMYSTDWDLYIEATRHQLQIWGIGT